MNKIKQKFINAIILIMACCLYAEASAQTIIFTGNESDFSGVPVAPLEEDPTDTEATCAPGRPFDINRVYATTDSTKLYIGVQTSHACRCDILLGIAIDSRPGGAALDPLNHPINWAAAPSPPDFVVYDANTNNCPNGPNENMETLYEADEFGGWRIVRTGVNALLILETPDFIELALSLSELGVDCAAQLGIEFFTTIRTEGETKPAYDMVANDHQQRSNLNNTDLDTPPAGTAQPSLPSNYLHTSVSCGVTSARTRTWGQVRAIYR